jgi:hypothetical protein
LCALVSTVDPFVLASLAEGGNKKKRTARERERERGSGERDIVNDLREKPKPTQKSSSLIIRRVPQALEVKNKKRAKRENEGGPRGVTGLIYVENMTQKNHDPDNILIQRQQEKLFFLLWVFKNFFELHLTFSKLLPALFI